LFSHTLINTEEEYILT